MPILTWPLLAWMIAPAQDRAPQGVHWPSFRGPLASGVAEGFPPPATWDVEKGVNIAWKIPIPGLGLSSPVVWGNRIYLSSAIGEQDKSQLKIGLYGNVDSVPDDSVHRWVVFCIDKGTGKILWERTARTGVPKIKRHPKSTHANSTLATDGRRVVAFFGSEGLYCYDMAGKLLWSKDLGVLDSGFFTAPAAQWEFGSSPAIFQDRVIVQCDVQKGSFVAALDLKDGREIWRASRDEVPTWGSPAIWTNAREAQVIVNGFKHIGGYDARTGQERWRMKGGGDIPVPTPVISKGLVFITNAHGRLSPIYAIRLGATGDISLQGEQTSSEHVAWSVARDGSYMATPIVYREHLYNCRWNGVLGCYKAATGTRLYQERLGGGSSAFSASPVAGDGRVYFTSEEGDVYVVKAGPSYELLAKNSLGEVCMATPAISEGALLFRTQGHLVAIRGK